MIKFTETQAFPLSAYGVLGITSGISLYAVQCIPGRIGWGFYWFVLPLALAWNLLFQRTTVTETELTVTFGAFLPLYRRRIPLTKIESAEAVTYAPIAEYGGWGIRGWGANTALNARGNRGVRLTLRDGRRVLVGSQRPDALANAVITGR